jgi:hypothetical protein
VNTCHQGKPLVNTQKEQFSDEWVTVEHAAHPLRGQKFRVVPIMGRQQEPNQVLIELPGGERRCMPIDWTNRRAVRVYPAGVRFPVEILQELREKLDGMEKATSMAEKSKGDSHGQGKNQRVAADDRRTAPASDNTAGADVVAADTGTGWGGER